MLRVVVVSVVIALVVVLLFTVVFPWVDQLLLTDPVMG